MSRLVLTYQDAVMREVPLGTTPVTIGRAPDNDLPIDNLAVSNYHARIYLEAGTLVVEDLNSLNGCFVNDVRVERSVVRDGDSILIGKHHILVDQTHDVDSSADALTKVSAPRVNETMILDTQARQRLLEQVAALGERSQRAPERLRIPTLSVVKGRTDQKEYRVAGKLTVIGKSSMATVKLRGWFIPKIAAQINRHEDGYYLGRGEQIPKVNGVSINGLLKLNSGDLIDVGRVRLSFSLRD